MYAPTGIRKYLPRRPQLYVLSPENEHKRLGEMSISILLVNQVTRMTKSQPKCLLIRDIDPLGKTHSIKRDHEHAHNIFDTVRRKGSMMLGSLYRILLV